MYRFHCIQNNFMEVSTLTVVCVHLYILLACQRISTIVSIILNILCARTYMLPLPHVRTYVHPVGVTQANAYCTTIDLLNTSCYFSFCYEENKVSLKEEEAHGLLKGS